jgi:hypothetical protein
MTERRYRSLTAIPGSDYFREEGIAVPDDVFGSSEIVLQSVIPELHVVRTKKGLSLTLDNPMRYGPVAIVHGQEDELLIPGETKILDEPHVIIMLKRREVIQILFLDMEDVWEFPMIAEKWS